MKSMQGNTIPRIGIFAGTFDPVHGGHISFALQARKTAALDEVCFVPERLPRDKPDAEHFGHRAAMLRRALRPYDDFSLLELTDRHFTVRRTLPQLARLYGGARLVLLMGSDTFRGLGVWPHAEQLLKACEFVVGVRSHDDMASVLQGAQALHTPLRTITIVDSLEPGVSSSRIRSALQLRISARGLLPSVQQYARREWLYTRIPVQR